MDAFAHFSGLLADLPALYAPGTAPFWDDPHISAQMLAAHLDPESDAASRRHDFMRRSADWIRAEFGAEGRLLDLGCGPGLYGELFAARGFRVTGVDLSARSVAYARSLAAKSGSGAVYCRMNYLDLDFENAFDAATLIYCDYGVLPPEDRRALLAKVRRALAPGGVLILDAHTREQPFEVCDRVETCASGGFWSPKPYVCVRRNRLYPARHNTLEQYVVLTADACECCNIWNQLYTGTELADELTAAGFGSVRLFGDVAGAAYTGHGPTVAALAHKVERVEGAAGPR